MNKDSVQSQGGVGSEALRALAELLAADEAEDAATAVVNAEFANQPVGTTRTFLIPDPRITAATDRVFKAKLAARSALKQASDPTPARLIEILRHERDEARARLERSIQILSGIHALLYPPHVKTPDGRVWAFKSPIFEEQMQALSDRIRAISDESPAIAPPPAASAPEQEAPLTDEPLAYAILDKMGQCSYRWWPDEGASIWHGAKHWDECYPHLAPFRLAALASAPRPLTLTYHRDDEGEKANEAYAAMMVCLDDAGKQKLANLVAHGAKATLGPGGVALTRADWTSIKLLPIADPQHHSGPNQGSHHSGSLNVTATLSSVEKGWVVDAAARSFGEEFAKRLEASLAQAPLPTELDAARYRWLSDSRNASHPAWHGIFCSGDVGEKLSAALAASPAHPITPGLLPSGAGIEPSVHPAVTSSDHRAPDACDTTGASHLPRGEQ